MAKDKKDTKEANKATKQQQAQAKGVKNKRKTTDKWKKKVWYTLVAPQEFERKEIGETIAEKPESLIGRVISVTGRELANQPKKQHFTLKFQVTNVAANKAHTESVGHSIKESYIKRIVRRKTSKVMVVENYPTKDNKVYKLKVVAITEKKCSRIQRTALRKKISEVTKALVADVEARKIVDEIVFGNLPNKIYSDVKKIVPTRRLEITNSTLITAK